MTYLYMQQHWWVLKTVILTEEKPENNHTYSIIPFIYNIYTTLDRKCKLNYNNRRQISGYLGKKKIAKGHKESFGSDEHVHYLDYGDDFTVYACQNLTNCTPFLYVNYTSKKLLKIKLKNLKMKKT